MKGPTSFGRIVQIQVGYMIRFFETRVRPRWPTCFFLRRTCPSGANATLLLVYPLFPSHFSFLSPPILLSPLNNPPGSFIPELHPTASPQIAVSLQWPWPITAPRRRSPSPEGSPAAPSPPASLRYPRSLAPSVAYQCLAICFLSFFLGIVLLIGVIFNIVPFLKVATTSRSEGFWILLRNRL